MAGAGGITFATLQKNLQQLDFDLHAALSLRTGQIQTRYDRISGREIRTRFLFLNSLLSAEMKSRPSERRHQLQDIKRRMTELEAAFDRWESAGPKADHDQCCDHFVPENVISTCCCSTESCVNHDGDGDHDDVGFDDRLGLVGFDEVEAAGQQELFEKGPAAAAESGGWEDHGGRRISRVWVFMGGMVFGMSFMGCSLLMLLPFYCNFGYVEQSTCRLFPT